VSFLAMEDADAAFHLPTDEEHLSMNQLYLWVRWKIIRSTPSPPTRNAMWRCSHRNKSTNRVLRGISEELKRTSEVKSPVARNARHDYPIKMSMSRSWTILANIYVQQVRLRLHAALINNPRWALPYSQSLKIELGPSDKLTP